MGEQSKISWTDDTWNPWRGCAKTSPGCKNCFAEALVNRFGGDFSKRVRAAKGTFAAPVRWNRKPWICECGTAMQDKIKGPWSDCDHKPHRRRVFLGSLMDWLDPEVPVEWLADALQVVWNCTALNFLLLTKRPELWKDRVQAAHDYFAHSVSVSTSSAIPSRTRHPAAAAWLSDWLDGEAPCNVWLGVSVEDQARADERVPELLKIPAAVRFLSVEPLLEKVELRGLVRWMPHAREGVEERQVAFTQRNLLSESGKKFAAFPDWVIVGGESGPNRRDCGVEALEDVARQCKAAAVPCFVKQDCAAKPGQRGRLSDEAWATKEFPANTRKEI